MPTAVLVGLSKISALAVLRGNVKFHGPLSIPKGNILQDYLAGENLLMKSAAKAPHVYWIGLDRDHQTGSLVEKVSRSHAYVGTAIQDYPSPMNWKYFTLLGGLCQSPTKRSCLVWRNPKVSFRGTPEFKSLGFSHE
jgi:hypothetical protein